MRQAVALFPEAPWELPAARSTAPDVAGPFAPSAEQAELLEEAPVAVLRSPCAAHVVARAASPSAKPAFRTRSAAAAAGGPPLAEPAALPRLPLRPPAARELAWPRRTVTA